jgi:hypothetical protein
VLQQYGNWSHEIWKDGMPILHQATGGRIADIIWFLFDFVQAAQHTNRVNELQIAQGDERQMVWHLTTSRFNVTGEFVVVR